MSHQYGKVLFATDRKKTLEKVKKKLVKKVRNTTNSYNNYILILKKKKEKLICVFRQKS